MPTGVDSIRRFANRPNSPLLVNPTFRLQVAPQTTRPPKAVWFAKNGVNSFGIGTLIVGREIAADFLLAASTGPLTTKVYTVQRLFTGRLAPALLLEATQLQRKMLPPRANIMSARTVVAIF